MRDERADHWDEQRAKHGFDDPDIWDLNVTIARFIIPRLIYFRDSGGGYPGCFKDRGGRKAWEAVITTMIEAFDLMQKDPPLNQSWEDMKRDSKTVHIGLRNFTRYFGGLWY